MRPGLLDMARRALVVVGALLVVPFVVLVQGATGTFRSSVWTLGFMEARG